MFHCCQQNGSSHHVRLSSFFSLLSGVDMFPMSQVVVPFFSRLCDGSGSAITAALRLVHAAFSIGGGSDEKFAEQNAANIDIGGGTDMSELTAESAVACAAAAGLAVDAVEMSRMSTTSVLSLCKAGALAVLPFRRSGGDGSARMGTVDTGGVVDVAVVLVSTPSNALHVSHASESFAYRFVQTIHNSSCRHCSRNHASHG